MLPTVLNLKESIPMAGKQVEALMDDISRTYNLEKNFIFQDRYRPDTGK